MAALLLATILAPVVRGTTVELNHSIGRMWPFARAHCATLATPGCETERVVRTVLAAPPARRATR